MLKRSSPLRLLGDARGAAALEFALIVPVMLVMFAGTAEVSTVLLAQRRTSHAVSAVGDLASRVASLSAADVQDVFSAGDDIMTPLDPTTLSLRLTEVTADATKTPKVDWSKSKGSAFSTINQGGTFTGLPSGLITAPNDVVVIAEASYAAPATTKFVIPTGIVVTKRAYLRPRHGRINYTN